MVKIHPDRLVGDLIAECRNDTRTFLIQLSNAEYRKASDLADRIGLPVSSFILAATVPESGIALAGQADRFNEQSSPQSLGIAIQNVDADTQRFIDRQAAFHGLPAEQYLADLVIRGLLQDESTSIIDPNTSEVLCHRGDVGKLLRTARKPQAKSEEGVTA